MSNMSYCRFQNTRTDFEDCANTVESIVAGDSPPLSREELDAAKALFRRAVDILCTIAESAGMELADLDEHGKIERALEQRASN